jgi:hypothetical protein
MLTACTDQINIFFFVFLLLLSAPSFDSLFLAWLEERTTGPLFLLWTTIREKVAIEATGRCKSVWHNKRENVLAGRGSLRCWSDPYRGAVVYGCRGEATGWQTKHVLSLPFFYFLLSLARKRSTLEATNTRKTMILAILASPGHWQWKDRERKTTQTRVHPLTPVVDRGRHEIKHC